MTLATLSPADARAAIDAGARLGALVPVAIEGVAQGRDVRIGGGIRITRRRGHRRAAERTGTAAATAAGGQRQRGRKAGADQAERSGQADLLKQGRFHDRYLWEKFVKQG